MSAEENLQRMKTLDDAWNAQDWEVFKKRHSTDTAVFWPGQPDPTRGRDAHQAESEAFFKSIENQLENNPYKVMFASGDWTCTIGPVGLVEMGDGQPQRHSAQAEGEAAGPPTGLHPVQTVDR
jgi:hypothetical protein